MAFAEEKKGSSSDAIFLPVKSTMPSQQPGVTPVESLVAAHVVLVATKSNLALASPRRDRARTAPLCFPPYACPRSASRASLTFWTRSIARTVVFISSLSYFTGL